VILRLGEVRRELRDGLQVCNNIFVILRLGEVRQELRNGLPVCNNNFVILRLGEVRQELRNGSQVCNNIFVIFKVGWRARSKNQWLYHVYSLIDWSIVNFQHKSYFSGLKKSEKLSQKKVCVICALYYMNVKVRCVLSGQVSSRRFSVVICNKRRDRCRILECSSKFWFLQGVVNALLSAQGHREWLLQNPGMLNLFTAILFQQLQ
jgi:hypothetical protein